MNQAQAALSAHLVSFESASPSQPDVICVAVDCMGGDHGPSVILPACASFLAAHPLAELILVGRSEAVEPARSWPRCRTMLAQETVEMHDSIEVALRRKRDSSMRVAIAQVKPDALGQSAAQVCVSAGNTGALMAVSRYVLKTVEGIDRPAIAAVMPNSLGTYTTVLDLGANIDCGPEHLLQFAIMGSALVAAVEGKTAPTVGLLNVGEEAIKGGETIKLTSELLRQAHARGLINFHGNVEGNDIYKGTTDIIVCDGFVGNVALKTSEGLAAMLADFIRQEFTHSAYAKFAAWVAMPVLKRFKTRVDHRRYNGAALLGLRGLVFKSHGSADAFAFERALERAYSAARNRLLDGVHGRILEMAGSLSSTTTPHIA